MGWITQLSERISSWWNREETVGSSYCCSRQGWSSIAEHTPSMREALDLTLSTTQGKRCFLFPNGVLEIAKIFSYRLILSTRLPPWGPKLHLSFSSSEWPTPWRTDITFPELGHCRLEAPLGAENSVSLPDPVKAHSSSPALLGMAFPAGEEKADP